MSPNVRYTREPMGINFLANMLPRISKAAGTGTVYTNHCLRSTTVQKLSDAGLEGREIVSVTGHKCVSSLQSYWHPDYDARRKWSNVLAGNKRTSCAESTPPPPVPPAKRSCTGNMQQFFFNNCTILGDKQININREGH